MAAPQENLLSLGQLTSPKRSSFTKQTGQNSVNMPVLWQNNSSTLQNHKHLRVMHLQQCWQELKERELAAQQHNKELLQQFAKAQDTLRELVVCNSTMKTIRMAFEQHLVERYPHWQQQLKEKTQAAKALRMGECLTSRLSNTEAQFSTLRHSQSQGPSTKPWENAATQDYKTLLDNNQDSSSHFPYIQASWLTQPESQTVRLPIRMCCQPQASSHLPPSCLPNPFCTQHLTSTSSHHHLWPRQDAPSSGSLQTDCPWYRTPGANGLLSGSAALWGQLYTEEPLPGSRVSQDVAHKGGTSRAPSTKSWRGGSRSSHLSQELDVKPVRLSSDPTESSESGRDSSHAIREKRLKREKRGRSQCTSSEKQRHPQESSDTTFVTASVAVQSSESDTLLEKCSPDRIKKTRKSGGQESQGMQNIAKKGTRSKNDEIWCVSEESRTETAGNQSANNKSECGTEGSKGNTKDSKNVGREEIKKQHNSSSEQSSTDEEEQKGHEKHQEHEDGEEDNAKEKENSQTEQKLEEDDMEEDDDEEKENSLNEGAPEEEKEEYGDVSVRKNTIKEEETEAEDGEEEYEEDRMKKENCESSASSQDEVVDDEIEKNKDETENEQGSGEEEDVEAEQRGDKAGKPEEESDSEHSILLSQENRSTKKHFIPEEAKTESETGSSDDHDSNDFSDDDIERLLAPQEQKKKVEKEVEQPKAICENVKIFQVEDDTSSKTDPQSTSDEFDHFYD